MRLAACLLLLGLSVGLPALASPSKALADASVSGDGFDTCAAPSTNQMADLRTLLAPNNEFIGIYTGGVTRGCAQPNLNASWVSTERAAGWDFIVLWTGYQDPCFAGPGPTAFSISPSSAFTQGTESAANAIAANGGLGFGPSGVFALDIEGYTSGPYVSMFGLANCEAAALAYQAGFDQTVSQSYYSETYGSSEDSDMSQYADGYPSPGQNIPTHIFFGEGNDQNNTNSAYIPSSEWNDGQRIHQYNLNIPYLYQYMPAKAYDQDCADATLSGSTNYSSGC